MDIYDIVKALHIIAVVCWFAGLFYLPRLFVYHVKANEQSREMLKTMEYRLYNYIMKPSMITTWVFGILLIYLNLSWLEMGWLHGKILLVLFLTAFHEVCGRYVKKFQRNENNKSEKFFRLFNEIPTILLIFIVFLVVLKPF